MWWVRCPHCGSWEDGNMVFGFGFGLDNYTDSCINGLVDGLRGECTLCEGRIMILLVAI